MIIYLPEFLAFYPFFNKILALWDKVNLTENIFVQRIKNYKHIGIIKFIDHYQNSATVQQKWIKTIVSLHLLNLFAFIFLSIFFLIAFGIFTEEFSSSNLCVFYLLAV
jgi:hypothetical protein